MFVLAIIGLEISIFISNFIDLLLLTTALCAYQTISEYSRFMENLKKWSLSEKRWQQGDVSCLVVTARKIEHFFDQLNLVVSRVCQCWFLSIIPWMSFKFMDYFPGSLIVKTSSSKFAIHMVYYWSYIFLYAVSLFCLVEAKRKVSKIIHINYLF